MVITRVNPFRRDSSQVRVVLKIADCVHPKVLPLSSQIALNNFLMQVALRGVVSVLLITGSCRMLLIMALFLSRTVPLVMIFCHHDRRLREPD